LGPIEALPPLSPLPPKRHLFAYSASNNPVAEKLAVVLMDLGADASAYFRGPPSTRAAILRSRGVHVYDGAPLLPSVLPGVSAVFSHGGPGFAHAALASGRPHIVSPRHLEALVTGRRLEALGAGIVVHPFDPSLLRTAVDRLFDDGKIKLAAQDAAKQAVAFMAAATPLDTTVSALREILG
jgi:hypothetical protein